MTLKRPRAFWIAVCNLVGLVSSVIGVVLLFFYALPDQSLLGPHMITDEGLPGGEAELASYHSRACVGLALVIVGTVLEAVAPLYIALGSRRRRRR